MRVTAAPALPSVRTAPALARQAKAPVAAAAPPIPRGTTVLQIGDSMAGALGFELGKRLRAAGVHAPLRFRASSSIRYWVSDGRLTEAIAQTKPDLVLVSLGANELSVKRPAARSAVIRSLVARIGDVPCVWIGVPLWKGARGELLAVIRDNVRPCRYFDTTRIMGAMPRLPDGFHPTLQARARWADRFFDWLTQQRDPHGTRPWQLVPEPDDAPMPVTTAAP